MARYARVASLTFGGVSGVDGPYETIRRNLEEIVKLLEKAALDEPDIVCLPECAPMLGLHDEALAKAAEEIPGPIFKKVSLVAREHGMYIVCPMMERRNRRIYNSAVLIDRDGEYVGSYHKIHPTIGEIESGVTPGTEPKTFKVDFGVLGFAICFDLNFEDVIKGLAKNEVDLIFFPSMYPGGLQLRIWAFNYGVFMVSAYTGEGSMIVDPLGRVLATSSSYSPILCETLNLDCEVFHIDYNNAKWDSIKEKYGAEVKLDVSRPEAVFLLTSNIQDVTVEDVAKEFQLETREEYFERATKIRNEALRS